MPDPAIATGSAPVPSAARSARRARWLQRLHRWHWISAATSLVAMLAFSVSGFTLNHAASIEASPTVTNRQSVLPDALQPLLRDSPARADAPLPPAIADWLRREMQVIVGTQAAEWTDDEVSVALPRPGGDAWVRVQRSDGLAEFEATDRGWIAWLNDLHKGRHTGPVWQFFIDVFAFACLLFATTGLLILKLHAAQRPATWPLTALGLALPAVVLLLFVH